MCWIKLKINLPRQWIDPLTGENANLPFLAFLQSTLVIVGARPVSSQVTGQTKFLPLFTQSPNDPEWPSAKV